MKNIIITGASSGIGKATAIKCIENGFSVIAHYRNNKGGTDDLVDLGKKLNIPVFIYRCELSIETEVKKLFEFSIQKLQKVDILINNAGGYLGDGDERNGDPKIWLKTYESNILPVLLCSKYFAEHFLKNKSGSILNIASRHGISGQLDCISYASSKAAIINITQAYSKLLAPFGTVNVISPGPVNTGYRLKASQEEKDENLKEILMQKFIEPEEIAKVLLYLCSNNISITGQNIHVDGGFSVI